MKNIDELKFTDDILFGAVLVTHPEIARRMAETITGRPVKEVLTINSELLLGSDPALKKVRLDVRFSDDMNIYSLEMMIYKEPELPKRLRYYAAASDIEQLGPGMPYKELKNLFMICICTYDPFGLNRREYVFRRQSEGIKLNDGCDIIVLNTEGDPAGVSEELNDLLDYLKTGMAGDDMLSQMIDRASVSIKNNKEWRERLMSYAYTRYGVQVEVTRERWNNARQFLLEFTDNGMSDEQKRSRIANRFPEITGSLYDTISHLEKDLTEADDAIIEEYLKSVNKQTEN